MGSQGQRKTRFGSLTVDLGNPESTEAKVLIAD